jgi:hypothetical protein
MLCFNFIEIANRVLSNQRWKLIDFRLIFLQGQGQR